MKRIAFTLSLIVALISVLNSQTGTIKGHIYDRREKAGLAFANVWLHGTELGTASDVDGNFILDNIPEGTYDLVIMYVGYGDTTLSGINIKSGDITEVYAQLPRPCKYENGQENNICPICNKSDKVVPIIYGLPVTRLDKKRNYYAGCIVSDCDPTWYCKRNEYKF